MKRPGLAPLLVALALLVTHAALLRVMAREQVAARLFAASSALAPEDWLLALAFLTLRLLAYFVAPGLLIYGLTRALRVSD